MLSLTDETIEPVTQHPLAEKPPLLVAPAGCRLRYEARKETRGTVIGESLVQRVQARRLGVWKTVSERTLMHWHSYGYGHRLDDCATWLNEHSLGYVVERVDGEHALQLQLVEYRLSEHFWYKPERLVRDEVDFPHDEPEVHLLLAETLAEMHAYCERENAALQAAALAADTPAVIDSGDDEDAAEAARTRRLLNEIASDAAVAPDGYR